MAKDNMCPTSQLLPVLGGAGKRVNSPKGLETPFCLPGIHPFPHDNVPFRAVRKKQADVTGAAQVLQESVNDPNHGRDARSCRNNSNRWARVFLTRMAVQ